MERIATPGMTRTLIKKHGFRIRKSLGQNFLVEPKFIDKILTAASLNREELVIEIGPGMGSLTQALAGEAGFVAAVEIDQALIPILQENLASLPNVSVTHGDALKIDFDLLSDQVPDREKFSHDYKIAANLPYYITTPVIMRILEGDYHFSVMVLMVQKEVALRMMAKPGTKDYGALSIGVQYHCLPSLVTLVPKTVFYPQPEVESAVVRLEKRAVPPVQVTDEKLMFDLVRAAFGQRRKTLLNALRSSGLNKTKEEWETILGECDIDPVRRGETLSIEEFARLANRVSC